MFHYNKLRGRIVEKYQTINNFASVLNVSIVSVSKKLNCRTGFTQADIIKWADLLDISPEEYHSYFFA